MLKKLFPLACCVLFLLNAEAQFRNNIWCFGDSAGIDFNGGAVPIVSGMDGRGSCVSVCDSFGNLILYAFTVANSNFISTHVYNFADSSIAGADSVTGAAWYGELVLVPKPSSTNIYYLFSVGVDQGINDGLFLTTIDMSLNGGLGQVLQQNVQLDTPTYGDCLTAIKHGNGRDWWIMGKYSHNTIPNFYNRFFVYLVTSDSIYSPIVQDFNDATDLAFQKIIWHPSNEKFMLINVKGYMSEFNFDRCTGIITLNRNIYPEQIVNYNRIFFDGAYSPNGNIFYVTRNSYGGSFGNQNYLLQYDLLAANIPASCDTLDSTMYPQADCGAVRLAPDGKIYYTQAYPYGFPYQDTMRNTVNQYLGVVNNPDLIGNGCNFAPFSFYLGGKRTYYGLPNNPNYELPALGGSLCDTLGLPNGLTPGPSPKERGALYVFYHPGRQTAFINASGLTGKNYGLHIVDISGKEVFSENGSLASTPSGGGGKYFTKDFRCADLQDGMYLVLLETEKERLVKKFVKE